MLLQIIFKKTERKNNVGLLSGSYHQQKSAVSVVRSYLEELKHKPGRRLCLTTLTRAVCMIIMSYSMPLLEMYARVSNIVAKSTWGFNTSTFTL